MKKPKKAAKTTSTAGKKPSSKKATKLGAKDLARVSGGGRQKGVNDDGI